MDPGYWQEVDSRGPSFKGILITVVLVLLALEVGDTAWRLFGTPFVAEVFKWIGIVLFITCVIWALSRSSQDLEAEAEVKAETNRMEAEKLGVWTPR